MKKIKINLFDKCTQNNRPHCRECSGVHGKHSQLMEYVTDGSGEVDIFSEHMIMSADRLGSAPVKIGWIKECEAINPTYFNLMRSKPDMFFDQLGLDYVFTYDEDICQLDSRFRKTIGEGYWIKIPSIYKKSKLVSMIVSNKNLCHYHSKRLEVKEKYKNDVDLFGVGHNEIERKEEGLIDYMFSFAMENDVVDTMMSEKLFDCFATGTIPIYQGTRRAGLYFNPDGIIFLDDDFDINNLSQEMYYSKMNAIQENFELVRELEVPIDYHFKDVLPQ